MGPPAVTPEKFILAVDVGNSRIKFGVFPCAPTVAKARILPECVASLRVPASRDVDWKNVTAHFEEWGLRVTSAVVAGANPAGVDRILSGWPAGAWRAPFPV